MLKTKTKQQQKNTTLQLSFRCVSPVVEATNVLIPSKT
jgi:hypothetical protein